MSTNFKKGLESRGVPVLSGERMWGTHYFVNPDTTYGSNSNAGTDKDAPFLNLTKAFAVVGDYDVIHCAPGNHTGNYTTPVNADAAFVTVIADATHENGMAAWMGASTASSPIIDVRARGWSFIGFEFNCPTGAAAIRLTSSTSNSPNRSDFTTIKNCIFTTGKFGVEVNGGNTHVHIQSCKFDQLTTSGAFAIHVTATGRMIPAFWVVEDCIFATSVNHIGPANGTYGWSSSTFRRNIHQADSAGQDVTMMLDIRGTSAGGNMVIDNYFDMTASEWTDGDSDAKLRSNSTDFGAGNECNDGPAETVMNV